MEVDVPQREPKRHGLQRCAPARLKKTGNDDGELLEQGGLARGAVVEERLKG